MYVITGVTGHTGSVVASTLLSQGKQVRVVVRDAAKGEAWKARGASVAVASLDDRAALAKALAGATEGVYLVLPPSAWNATEIPAERAKLIEAIRGGVADAKPAHVVLLSSMGADLEAGSGPVVYLHRLEEALKATGVQATFLRAAYFMDNWGGMVKGAIEQGALYYGLKSDLAISQVATEDIGKTAAKLLVEGASKVNPRIVQLAGPEDLSLADTASILSKVAGKDIKAVSVPLDAMIGALTGMGASKDLAELFAEMTGAINDGRMAWQGSDLQRGSTTLETKLKRYV